VAGCFARNERYCRVEEVAAGKIIFFMRLLLRVFSMQKLGDIFGVSFEVFWGWSFQGNPFLFQGLSRHRPNEGDALGRVPIGFQSATLAIISRTTIVKPHR